jgi:hypothetical protein
MINNCASRWSFTKNHNTMHSQQNVKFCGEYVSATGEGTSKNLKHSHNSYRKLRNSQCSASRYTSICVSTNILCSYHSHILVEFKHNSALNLNLKHNITFKYFLPLRNDYRPTSQNTPIQPSKNPTNILHYIHLIRNLKYHSLPSSGRSISHLL